MTDRRGRVERTTRETSIVLEVALDGGPIAVATDVRFLNHMLEAFAKHAGLGLELRATGDGMDHHHVVEDVGIALGRALRDALGDKVGLARFGSMSVPLDDALVHASVDLSGRAYCNVDVPFMVEALGDLKTEMIPHFFRSVTDEGKFNLHLVRLAGTNAHHLCEASFKSFARAFAQAAARTGSRDVASTKGVLE